MSDELTEHLITDDKPRTGGTYSSLNTPETAATNNLRRRKKNVGEFFAKTSSLGYSAINPVTYSKNVPDILPSIINTKAEHISPDAPFLKWSGFVVAFLSYFPLAYDTYQTYKKIIAKLYGPEEVKTPPPETKSRQRESLPQPTESKVASKIKQHLSPVIKGTVSSWAFGQAFADLVGATGILNRIITTAFNLSLLFPNIYAQKKYFDFGQEHFVDDNGTLNINEHNHTESKRAQEQQKCLHSFRQLVTWDNFAFISALVYSLTNPATYIKSFQGLFPDLVEDLFDLIREDLVTADSETLSIVVNGLCLLCYCALVYENVNQYKEMLQHLLQRNQHQHPQGTEATEERLPAKEACWLLSACFNKLSQSPCCVRMTERLKTASQYLAATSKGVVSSINLGNFFAGVLSFFSCSDKTASTANIAIIFATLLPNIHSQLLAFSIAKKSPTHQPPISSGTRITKQSFASFVPPEEPSYEPSSKTNNDRSNSFSSTTYSFYHFDPKEQNGSENNNEVDHSPESPKFKYPPDFPPPESSEIPELSPPKPLTTYLVFDEDDDEEYRELSDSSLK